MIEETATSSTFACPRHGEKTLTSKVMDNFLCFLELDINLMPETN
jgi:hypothetical protein